MSGFSQYIAQAIFDATLKSTRSNMTAAPGVFLALHTAAPTDAAGGNEATFAGYVRVDIASKMTSSVVVSSPESTVRATNTSDILFPASTGATQTVSHWSIYDSVTAGNMLYSGALTASRSVQSGDVVVVPAGIVSIDLI